MRAARPERHANGHAAERKRANGSRGHKGAKTEVGSPVGGAARYAKKAATELILALSDVVEDPRGLLDRAAYRFGGLVYGGHYDRSEAADLLRGACITNGLVSSVGEDAVQEAIASGVIAGIQAAIAERSRRQADHWAQAMMAVSAAPNPSSGSRADDSRIWRPKLKPT